jgi:hypothetical protein
MNRFRVFGLWATGRRKLSLHRAWFVRAAFACAGAVAMTASAAGCGSTSDGGGAMGGFGSAARRALSTARPRPSGPERAPDPPTVQVRAVRPVAVQIGRVRVPLGRAAPMPALRPVAGIRTPGTGRGGHSLIQGTRALVTPAPGTMRGAPRVAAAAPGLRAMRLAVRARRSQAMAR